MREFDLNIEKVLENWTVAHAIREIIANALDEQTITNTQQIEIRKDKDKNWHIRDYGRGIKYIHLTQNENTEKLNHPKLIGKFGVGLKDALATFDRHNIGVLIKSKYGNITIGKSSKHGFDDITTLHAYIDTPEDSNFDGTDFILSGCTDLDIQLARGYFLLFTNAKVIEVTEYGEIYEKSKHNAEIYINGILVAEEENFLFSYNITSLTGNLRKALNRERTNVGRAAYSDRIRSILLNSTSQIVINMLSENLSTMGKGTQCDELKWIDVQVHTIKLVNEQKDVVFITPNELERSNGDIQDILHSSEKKIVFIPENVKMKINNITDNQGKEITTVNTVVKEYNNSFSYNFISPDKLNPTEKKNWNLLETILGMFNTKIRFNQCYISSTLQPDIYGFQETQGVWDSKEQKIIIKRNIIENRKVLFGVFIHELIHAETGLPDVDRRFETCLTNKIGEFSDLYFALLFKQKETANVEIQDNFAILKKEYNNIIEDLKAKLRNCEITANQNSLLLKEKITELQKAIKQKETANSEIQDNFVLLEKKYNNLVENLKYKLSNCEISANQDALLAKEKIDELQKQIIRITGSNNVAYNKCNNISVCQNQHIFEIISILRHMLIKKLLFILHEQEVMLSSKDIEHKSEICELQHRISILQQNREKQIADLMLSSFVLQQSLDQCNIKIQTIDDNINSYNAIDLNSVANQISSLYSERDKLGLFNNRQKAEIEHKLHIILKKMKSEYADAEKYKNIVHDLMKQKEIIIADKAKIDYQLSIIQDKIKNANEQSST